MHEFVTKNGRKDVIKQNFRSIDLVEMLFQTYNEILPLSDNFNLLTEDGAKIYNEVVTNAIDNRITTSLSTLEVLREIHSLFSKYYKEEYKDILSFLSKPFKQDEVIAYRIEKYAQEPNGDNRTALPLQNFWIYSDINEDLIYKDLQVKYGKEYVYKVYQYRLVFGHKYKYSDFILSRDLGLSYKEFYNPSTGVEAPYLFQTDNIAPINNTNLFSSQAQVRTNEKFLSQFRVTFEPSLRIIEIPIETKNITILDHPLNNISVSPYHIQDMNNIIGFDINYLTFADKVFPSVLTEADQRYKDIYLASNDYSETDTILDESVSAPLLLEIYMLKEKPKNISDFKGNLLVSKPLTFGKNEIPVRSISFKTKVKENTEYYFIFRYKSQNNILNQYTKIYYCKLVEDGGFFYPKFDILTEEDLIETNYLNPTTTFKKLLQARPAMKHLIVNDSNANLQNNAVDEIENVVVGVEDEFWDKRWKFRITSKKTGKKIDLNITYKITNEI